VPCGYKSHVRGDDAATTMAIHLARHAERLIRIREMTGKIVRLGLEPEPFCVLATVGDVAAYFERALLPVGVPELARRLGIDRARAERELREHVGICLDACHAAVELEDPATAVRAAAAAGIRIVKLQISAGLEVAPTPEEWPSLVTALARLSADRYLHQVTEVRGYAISRWEDLPEALVAAQRLGPPSLWRIHFHVPVFEKRVGSLRTTQAHLEALLGECRTATSHFEVETYTWDAIPGLLREAPLAEAIAREIRWARDRLEATK
jgi:hypothetical protein